MPIDPITLARRSAILVCAAGIGIWSALLLAPRPQALPPGLTAPPPARSDIAPLAQWFGASASSAIKVAIVGLISAGERGTAVLRVDGQVPQAYRVGQTVAQGMTLVRVEANAVVLSADGTTQRVQAPVAPVLSSPGFVSVQR